MRIFFIAFLVIITCAIGNASTLHKMADNTCVAITSNLDGQWTSSAWWDTNSRWTDLTNNASYNLNVSLSSQVTNAEPAYYITVLSWGWNGASWAYGVGSAPGAGTLVSGSRVSSTVKDSLLSLANNVSPVSEFPTGPPPNCVLSQCPTKQGQSNYNLLTHASNSGPSLASSCYEDCQTTTELLWEDCINDSCVSSVKYTFTGQPCGSEPGVNDLEPDPPERCTEEIQNKIAQCGGSLNVLSFNFETCTGECTPDSCSDEYASLLQRCGGFMGIATWDATTCKGTCVSDPVPEEPGPTDKPPVEIKHEEVSKPDGSKDVTSVSSYYNSQEDYTYTSTTTNTYDSTGAKTGTVVSTTKTPGNQTGDGEGDESETFPGISSPDFGQPYSPGVEFNVGTRFGSFMSNIQSSGLFSFSSSFFNAIPGGGSPVYSINGGHTFGSHSIDLSETMTTGLAVLKSILLACFGFLSIRAIIMKR